MNISPVGLFGARLGASLCEDVLHAALILGANDQFPRERAKVLVGDARFEGRPTAMDQRG
jgi:hypothetical protein